MGREVTTSQPTTKQDRLCKNCQRRPAAKKRSRCSGCYKYWKVNHVERPERLYKRVSIGDRGGRAGWCEVCGNTKVHASGKCVTCYDRWVKDKSRRPKWLWDDDYRCKTCNVPLKSMGHYKNGRRRQVKGYCVACYKYKRRTGSPRPRELWGDGPHGFCECGYPAVALVEDIPVCGRHKE